MNAWGMALFMAVGAMLPMIFTIAMDDLYRPRTEREKLLWGFGSFVAFVLVFRFMIWALT